VVGTLVAIAALLQLFLGRDVGLADNGDGARAMCGIGLGRSGGLRSVLSFDWHVAAPKVCQPRPLWAYHSSYSALLKPVVAVERLLTGHQDFDLRVLGVTWCLLLGVAIGCLVAALPGSTRSRTALGAMIAFACLDVGFLSYFSSPYVEPGGMLGILFLMAAITAWLTSERPRFTLLLAVTTAALFTAENKSQLAVVGVAVVPLMLVPRLKAGRRLPALTAGRIPALACAGVLILGSTSYLHSQGENLQKGNAYNVMFYSVLARSPDPARDLAEMHLPPVLAAYVGTSAWQHPAWFNPVFVANQHRVLARGTVLRFLARHPARALDLYGLSATATTRARVGYLANYEGGAKQGLAPLAHRWSPVFWALQRIRPVAGMALAGLWLGGLGWGISALARGWRLPGNDPSRVAAGGLAVFLALLAIGQAVVVPLGDGLYEIDKHSIFTAYATGLLAVVLLSRAGFGRRRGSRATSDAVAHTTSPTAVDAHSKSNRRRCLTSS